MSNVEAGFRRSARAPSSAAIHRAVPGTEPAPLPAEIEQVLEPFKSPG
jgi:hypothetical protein